MIVETGVARVANRCLPPDPAPRWLQIPRPRSSITGWLAGWGTCLAWLAAMVALYWLGSAREADPRAFFRAFGRVPRLLEYLVGAVVILAPVAVVGSLILDEFWRAVGLLPRALPPVLPPSEEAAGPPARHFGIRLDREHGALSFGAARVLALHGLGAAAVLLGRLGSPGAGWVAGMGLPLLLTYALGLWRDAGDGSFVDVEVLAESDVLEIGEAHALQVRGVVARPCTLSRIHMTVWTRERIWWREGEARRTREEWSDVFSSSVKFMARARRGEEFRVFLDVRVPVGAAPSRARGPLPDRGEEVEGECVWVVEVTFEVSAGPDATHLFLLPRAVRAGEAPPPEAPPVLALLDLVARGFEADAACPYCGAPLGAEDAVVACLACETAHHRDCWGEADRCTTYGCGGRRARGVTLVSACGNPGPPGPGPGAPPRGGAP